MKIEKSPHPPWRAPSPRDQPGEKDRDPNGRASRDRSLSSSSEERVAAGRVRGGDKSGKRLSRECGLAGSPLAAWQKREQKTREKGIARRMGTGLILPDSRDNDLLL